MPARRDPAKAELPVKDEDWIDEAACRGMAPADADAVFYPAMGGDYDRARVICQRCPVVEPCLERAMTAEASRGTKSRFGMFGGLSPTERYWYRLPTVT